jgi:tricorn protease
LLPVLALVVLLGLPETAAADDSKATQGLRYPSLSPDGKQVTFAYRGDIWVAETTGKEPRITRLTVHEAQDTLPRFSPDGKTIAFASQRSGGYDLFTVPAKGGLPTRVTWHSGLEVLCDFSPDGKKLLFVSNRDARMRGLDAYEVPVTGGAVRRLTDVANVREANYSKDGKQIVFVRGTNTIYQDNYTGSANYDIWTQGVPAPGKDLPLPKRLTTTDGNERYPFFSADAKTIFYVAEEKGVANFYSMPAAGGERKKLTDWKGADVHRPDMAADFKHAAFERTGRLYITDLTADKPEAKALDLKVLSDVRHSGVARRTINSGTQQVDVSADGGTLVFAVHGDIWSMAANGGNARKITSGPALDEWPRLSPDGRTIAFQSDESGNSDIWLIDRNGQNRRRLTSHAKGDFFHAWSPDGQRLVFCSERSGNRDIWTIEIASKETKQLTKHQAADDDPVFSPDGRTVAFDSGREGNQAVYIMNADGSNVRRVTSGNGFFQVPNFSPNGKFLVYEAFNPGRGQAGGLFVIGVGGGPSMQLSQTGSSACWGGKGDYIYYTAGENGREEIFRVPAPRAVENREKVPFIGTVNVDLKQELADLFDEAWRAMQRGFYDAKMHGVDWEAMKKKYRAMAIDSEIKSEFQNVISQMLAELNASHLGIFGGVTSSNAVPDRTPATGYLGADLAETPTKEGGRKILSVWKGGPADKAGLRAGDVLTRINKKRLKSNPDIDKLLAGTAGKEIEVRFRPFTEDGLGDERTADPLKPMAAQQVAAMSYARWTADNRSKVQKASKGRLAYLHLSQMNPANLAKFQRAIGNWIGSKRIEGLVLDVRGNGGGNIHQQLMQVLMAKPFAWVGVRGQPKRTSQPALYWDRPVVVLIDQRSFSDAEVFPHIFKALGRGKVVGMPTPGGVIGTNDITLSDGTRFRVPRVGYYALDGTNLEGTGVKPDFMVDITPEDMRKGRDPQLAKAIAVIQDEVKEWKASQKRPTKVTKPAATTKPEVRPDVKPEEGTTPPKPTPVKPMAAASTHGVDPLASVKVGEWVRYKVQIPNQPEGSIVKVQVDDIEDDVVHGSMEVEEGQPVQIPLPMEWRKGNLLDNLAGLGNGVKSEETKQETLRGKQVDVLIARIEFGGGQVELHFTESVMAWGLLRVKIGNHVLMEATEWGEGEVTEEAPAKAADAPVKPAPAAPAKPAPAAPAKPVEKTPVTEDTPVSQAPAMAAEEDQVKSPLYDAKVGEWVRRRMVVGGEEVIATIRVVAVKDDEVHVQSTMQHGDTQIKGDVSRRPRREHLALRSRGGQRLEVGEATLEVAGKKLICTVVTRTLRRGGVEKRWYSNEVPVTGLVRREREGRVISEVLAWGSDASAESGASR